MKAMKIDGLPVKNATKSITIHISANDVKNGTLKKPQACAAALCCKRELGATEARVHTARVFLRHNGHWTRYMTSAALKAEIVAFDRGGKFEPGEYRLNKMQPSRAHRKKSGPRTGKGKKRGHYHILTNVRPRAPHGNHAPAA